MQKSCLQVTVHFKNLKFPNTGNQLKEMLKEVQQQQVFIHVEVKKRI